MNMFDNIIKIICAGEGISLEQVKDETRKGEIVFTRQLIMFFAIEFKCGTQAYVGSRFEKDHATTFHACKTIQDYYETDKNKRELIDYYRTKITGAKKVIDLGIDLERQIQPLRDKIAEAQADVINLQLAIKNVEELISTI